MTLFKKLYFIIPFLIIIFELMLTPALDLSPPVNPASSRNNYLNNLVTLLRIAGFKPLQITIRDYQNEVEFSLQNNNSSFPVVVSTNKTPISQVTALQKLFKIANIKGKDIRFIDFSTPRPYATL
jgi:hypothetical protein